MSGLSINNMNNGNSHYVAGFSGSKENFGFSGSNEFSAEKSGSPVSKLDGIEVFTPPEPFNVLEPFDFENPLELPFDWDSVMYPFEMLPPEEFHNPYADTTPLELNVPLAGEFPEGAEVVSSVMEPYTHGDGGVSKAAIAGKKVSQEELGEKYKCATCESRKYQDVSNDPGVSFQTPTKVSKENSHSAVAAHEKQHVYRNQDKAEREGREVVSQTVTYHSDVCEECGDTYTSGGTTKTVTREKQETPNPETQRAERKKFLEKLSFSFEV